MKYYVINHPLSIAIGHTKEICQFPGSFSICTTNRERARELANFLGVTNRDRQRVVDDVVLHAKEVARKREWRGVIVLAHESYHEGVIGLAASKIVEEFWRPAIVIARSENISKASARSVSGFNIIENIRKLDNLVI